MKKRNNIKKEVKKIKKTEDSMVNKRRKRSEPDPWKEIRLKLKPLGKAYNNQSCSKFVGGSKRKRIFCRS